MKVLAKFDPCISKNERVMAWIFSYLYVCKKSYLATLDLGHILKFFFFFNTPLRGGWGKKIGIQILLKFLFLIFRKSQKVSKL